MTRRISEAEISQVASSETTSRDTFWAKITSFNQGSDGIVYYAWTEVQANVVSSSPGFIDLVGGRSGTISLNPAVNPNNISIPDNNIVQLRLGYFDTTYNWVFEITYGNPAVIAYINSGPNANNLYDATIQWYDPNTNTWSNGFNIWLRDANM